jgi:hypothetical protein
LINLHTQKKKKEKKMVFSGYFLICGGSGAHVYLMHNSINLMVILKSERIRVRLLKEMNKGKIYITL